MVIRLCIVLNYEVIRMKQYENKINVTEMLKNKLIGVVKSCQM